MITAATGAFVEARSNDFWNSIGIYPAALKKKSSHDGLTKDIQSQLKSLGHPNLKLLLEHATLPYEPQDSESDLASRLISSSDIDTLIHLREFMRRKADSIASVFERVFGSRQQAFEAELDNLSGERRTPPLKKLTKLLLLFRESPERLSEVFFRELWLSRPTYVEFAADKPFATSIRSQLEKAVSEIEKFASRVLSTEVRASGIHKLIDGEVVVVLEREYAASIKRDYREKYNVHYASGLVIFGISSGRDRLVVKLGNSQFASSLQSFLQGKLSRQLTPVHSEIYRDFEASEFSEAVLGGYSSVHGIELIGASFRRSTLASRCALTLDRVQERGSIAHDLKDLADHDVVAVRSLDDLNSLTVLFDGRIAKVSVKTDKGGAIRLTYDDTGWDSHESDALSDAFEETFGVQLNRIIDPQKLELGGTGIIARLLNMGDERDVLPYQESYYQRLIESGILVRESRSAKVCKTFWCKSKPAFIEDDISICPACNEDLDDSVVFDVTRDLNRYRGFVGDLIGKDGKWALGTKRSFEGTVFWPVRDLANDRMEEVSLLFRDRLTDKAKKDLRRSSLPIAVVRPHITDSQLGAIVDGDGLGQVSFSYLFSSCEESGSAEEDARSRCHTVFGQLLATQTARVEEAGRQSYLQIADDPTNHNDQVFETDVFNVLRSLFPYSYRLGRVGKAEPDGFVSVPALGEAGEFNLEDLTLWNFSYDAKLSFEDDGYKLGRDEQRKIVEYIDSLRGKTGFFRRQIGAHVLLSNHLTDKQMRKAAKYVYGDDGVRPKNRDVVLAVMEVSFLTKLYELVNQQRDPIQQRRLWFDQKVVSALRTTSNEDFLRLDAAVATQVVEGVLAEEPIDNALSREHLLRVLDA